MLRWYCVRDAKCWDICFRECAWIRHSLSTSVICGAILPAGGERNVRRRWMLNAHVCCSVFVWLCNCVASWCMAVAVLGATTEASYQWPWPTTGKYKHWFDLLQMSRPYQSCDCYLCTMNVLRAAIIGIYASIFGTCQYFEELLPYFVCKIGDSCQFRCLYMRQVLSRSWGGRPFRSNRHGPRFADAGRPASVHQAHEPCTTT